MISNRHCNIYTISNNFAKYEHTVKNEKKKEFALQAIQPIFSKVPLTVVMGITVYRCL